MEYYNNDQVLKSAIKKNDEISKFIMQAGKKIGVEESFLYDFAQNDIVLVVEDEVDNFVFNKAKPVSIKPGNVFIDLKRTVESLVQIGIALQPLKSWINVAQLILLVIFYIKDVAIIELPPFSSEILTVLIQKGQSTDEIFESELHQKVIDLCKANEEASEAEIYKTVSLLSEYGVISIDDGKIKLKERVFGKDFYHV